MAGLGNASLNIIWTKPALADLDQIADYIALDKPDAAKRLVHRVFESVERLADFPKSGSCPKELRGTTYRHLIIPPLRIFYRVHEKQIFIICVMRGERLFHLDELTGREK
ncbi:MAG: type II toxin-antitoxin system RelE/ParE family toxin [Verrucomicrobiota bacterium]